MTAIQSAWQAESYRNKFCKIVGGIGTECIMSLSPDQVVSRYGAGIARVAATYERNPAIREELVQDILVAVVSALPRLRDAERLKAFVYRIAHNVCVDHVASEVRLGPQTSLSEDIASDATPPETRLIEKQAANSLQEAVRQLKLPYRQVITLVLEGLSHQDVADALGITVTNVGVRVSRAKSMLKELLEDD